MFTRVGYKSCYLSEGALSILLFSIYLLSVGCMDKTSTKKYGNQSVGYWVINDAILTANLYEIAKERFPLINSLDTTKYLINLYGNQSYYHLFFSDKSNLEKLEEGGGYVIRFKKDDLMPIDLKRTQ